MEVFLLVFATILVAYVFFLTARLKSVMNISRSRQEVIDDLLATQKYHDELRDEVLNMIAADCTFEEIEEYLVGL
jgi:Na+-translocating ferredoxin:NAD+ oxidoreductase RnfG subunit